MTPSSGAESQAKRLYDDLLSEKSSYNKLIRPVGNTSESLTVKIGLKLTSIIDVVSTIAMSARVGETGVVATFQNGVPGASFLRILFKFRVKI